MFKMIEIQDTEQRGKTYSEQREIKLSGFNGQLASYVAQQVLGLSSDCSDKNVEFYSHRDLQTAPVRLMSDFSAVYIHGDRQARDKNGRFINRTELDVERLWYDYEVRKLKGIAGFENVDDLVVLNYIKDTVSAIPEIIKTDPSKALTNFQPSLGYTKRHWNNVRISKSGEGVYLVELVGIEHLKGKKRPKQYWERNVYDNTQNPKVLIRRVTEELVQPPFWTLGDMGIDALVEKIQSFR
jgi:hypothetical protein